MELQLSCRRRGVARMPAKKTAKKTATKKKKKK
jgi:hypothetical protein